MNEDQLPPELDLSAYKAAFCPAGMTDDEARRRFYTYGANAGEAGSPFCARGEFTSWLNQRFRDQDTLEIAPGIQPAMIGSYVKYYGSRNSEKLGGGVGQDNAGSREIPRIDYPGDMTNVDIVERKFDLIFSAHDLAYAPDLITYLDNCASLLKCGGLLALTIPDKRFTFAHYRRESDIADALEAWHCSSQAKIGFHEFYEAAKLRTHNDASRHWACDYGLPVQSSNPADLFAAYNKTGMPPDFQRWIFTSGSFYTLINELYEYGFIPLKPARVWNTPRNCNSFNAILRRSGAKADRDLLLANTLSQQLQGLGWQKLAAKCGKNLSEDRELCAEIMLHKRFGLEQYLVWLWQKLQNDRANDHAESKELALALNRLYEEQLFAESAPGISRLLYGIWLWRYDLHKFDPTSPHGQAYLHRWFREWGMSEFNLTQILTH